jgi:hypothetical protein
MKLALKRQVAVILPICLVWLFAACVAICSSHAEKVGRVTADASHSHLLADLDGECCSITNTQALSPERFGFFVPLLHGIVGPESFSVSNGLDVSDRSFPLLLPSTSPPAKFSGTLRI